MELEQPERAVQARRSEVTSPKALARNRSRPKAADPEPAPAPQCPESRRDQQPAAARARYQDGHWARPGAWWPPALRPISAQEPRVCPLDCPPRLSASRRRDPRSRRPRARLPPRPLRRRCAPCAPTHAFCREAPRPVPPRRRPLGPRNPTVPCACREAPRPVLPQRRPLGPRNPTVPCARREAPRPVLPQRRPLGPRNPTVPCSTRSLHDLLPSSCQMAPTRRPDVRACRSARRRCGP